MKLFLACLLLISCPIFAEDPLLSEKSHLVPRIIMGGVFPLNLSILFYQTETPASFTMLILEAKQRVHAIK